jgi:cytochrome c553
VLDWAEVTYPSLFTATGEGSLDVAGWRLRQYPVADPKSVSALGVSVSTSATPHLYYYGPLSQFTLLDLGLLSDWLSTAKNAWPNTTLPVDPWRGSQLFATPPKPGMLACADCHGENPTANNFGNIYSGRNAVALIQRAVSSNTGGMGVFNGWYNASDLADIAAFLGVAPNKLLFAPRPVGTVSATQTVTISSSAKTGLNAISISAQGDFVLAANSCATTLARFSACRIEVAFKPTQSASRSGQILIMHDGLPAPVKVLLQGTGI